MKVLRDPLMGEFWIDEKAGKVWSISRSIKGKGRRRKEEVSKMLFKGFRKISEAYDYLATVTRTPAWKLRVMTREMEE